jgi:hypothetical protein
MLGSADIGRVYGHLLERGAALRWPALKQQLPLLAHPAAGG